MSSLCCENSFFQAALWTLGPHNLQRALDWKILDADFFILKLCEFFMAECVDVFKYWHWKIQRINSECWTRKCHLFSWWLCMQTFTDIDGKEVLVQLFLQIFKCSHCTGEHQMEWQQLLADLENVKNKTNNVFIVWIYMNISIYLNIWV